MLKYQTFEKILIYLDEQFRSNKTTETNWNYFGLIFDEYFDNSVLSIDYLSVEDFLESNGDFSFNDESFLVEQYRDIPVDQYLLLIQDLLNIINHSQMNKERTSNIIIRVISVLRRENIKVITHDNGEIFLKLDDILDEGSYCVIIKQSNGSLKKELKSEYKKDKDMQKRMKYEFENMQKLSDCPQILKVYNFDFDKFSYLMEQADMNLYNYLTSEIELSLEKKLKIIMDILKGMNYAHENSIIHRDLHLGNILKIEKDFVICDFGLSKDISIERSLKTSCTEKNNHIFVDPLAINDFSKLDKKSDIYSIGKLIDYIFTYDGSNTNHFLKTIVERCIARDKKDRYESISEIISSVEITLKYQDDQNYQKEIIGQILNNQYNVVVHEYLMDLIQVNKLCSFIVSHQLNRFGELIMKFDSVHQFQLVQEIFSGFSESTGYGGWGNYDIFADIAFYLCLNLQAPDISKKALSILEECAGIRYYAEDLLSRLPDR